MIRTKAQMYELLTSNRLGNTNPSWDSFAKWDSDPKAAPYEFWGVRSVRVPGDPRCAMYVPKELVHSCCEAFGDDPFNVSPMVDAFCAVKAWLEVFESDSGLVVEGVPHPPRGLSWRQGMRDPKRLRRWTGSASHSVLAWALNENSHDDLFALFELYPGHVVEMSALDRCFGTLPGRSAVVWEVRNY